MAEEIWIDWPAYALAAHHSLAICLMQRFSPETAEGLTASSPLRFWKQFNKIQKRSRCDPATSTFANQGNRKANLALHRVKSRELAEAPHADHS